MWVDRTTKCFVTSRKLSLSQSSGSICCMSDLEQRSQKNSATKNLEFGPNVLRNSAPTSQCVGNTLRSLMGSTQFFSICLIEDVCICSLLAHVTGPSTVTISEDVAREELIAVDYGT
jgi:hypothetical protein